MTVQVLRVRRLCLPLGLRVLEGSVVRVSREFRPQLVVARVERSPLPTPLRLRRVDAPLEAGVTVGVVAGVPCFLLAKVEVRLVVVVVGQPLVVAPVVRVGTMLLGLGVTHVVRPPVHESPEARKVSQL